MLEPFLDPGLVRRHGWLRGTQVQVGISNLYDARPRVRDAAGATPIGCQPDYVDPLGRSIRLGIRKLFRAAYRICRVQFSTMR